MPWLQVPSSGIPPAATYRILKSCTMEERMLISSVALEGVHAESQMGLAVGKRAV